MQLSSLENEAATVSSCITMQQTKAFAYLWSLWEQIILENLKNNCHELRIPIQKSVKLPGKFRTNVSQYHQAASNKRTR